MRLSEPTTAITDYLLAVELLLLGTLAAAGSSQTSVRLWGASFLAMGAAAIAGGTFHAGRFAFDDSLLQRLWNGVRIGIAVSFGLLVVAGATSTSGMLHSLLLPAGVMVVFMSVRGLSGPPARGRRKAIKTVAVLFLLAPTLLLVQVLHRGSPAGTWVFAGSAIAAAALAVQQARIAIHRNFNHNDLFHVVMMAAYYFLYRGGLLLRDP